MNILIVAPAWVGDMVMAHTLVQVLQDRYADVCIDMLAPPATASLGARMPGVRDTYRLDVGHGQLGIGERWRTARELPAYDQAILLPNTIKSALVPLFAGVRRRTGWVGESRWGLLNDIRKLDAARYPLMIERFMALGLDAGAALATPYPHPVLESDGARTAELQAQHGLADRAVVLCPGAEFGPAKRWPETHYASVARGVIEAGGEVWLMGSPKDREVCDVIEHAVGADAVKNLAGKTSMLDAIDLIACASVVVCNDSGLMHVAAALGRRVVAVYGSTSPDFTPPLAAEAQIVRLGLDCSPCFERECPLGHLDCLNKLGPERVQAHL